MIFGKTDPGKCAPKATTTFPVSQHRALWIEVIRLAWISAAIYLLLSLLSYSPSDPSWSTWSSKQVFQNWMGRAGSVLADVAFQFFGIAAFAFAGLLAALAARSPAETEPAQLPLRGATPVIFLVSLSSLIQSLSSRDWHPGN